MHHDELAAAVNEAMAPIGYAWAGGVVLTELDDPRAQTVIAINPLGGAIAPTLGVWVSWCTPSGGLTLPPDVPVAPQREATALDEWQSLHAIAAGTTMAVVAASATGEVLYVLATQRDKSAAPLLAKAVLRTLLDSDTLPTRAEDAVASPPDTWRTGWTLDRGVLIGDQAA